MTKNNIAFRRNKERVFHALCLLATIIGVAALVVLIVGIAGDGLGRIRPEFFQNFTSSNPQKAGIKAALWGSLWIVSVTGLISVPVGVAAAVYLEEYARRSRVTDFIQTNIANLAGVPSIVYGLLGLSLFVYQLHLKKSVLSGALTLSLLILPTVIIATQEALRAVPSSLREASFGLGATRWQTIQHQVLPSASGGILTGIILALSRAMGETAPLIAIGAAVYIGFTPDDIGDRFTVMPIQIFTWASRPQAEFREAAAAAIVVLLGILLTLNSVALFLRQRLRGERRN